MPQKVMVTIQCPRENLPPEAQSALNSIEKCGTLSTVIIPPLTTSQIFVRNFMIGIARGLGFFSGGTVIIGMLAWTIQSIVSMNIPYLTEIFRQLLTFIKTT